MEDGDNPPLSTERVLWYALMGLLVLFFACKGELSSNHKDCADVDWQCEKDCNELSYPHAVIMSIGMLVGRTIALPIVAVYHFIRLVFAGIIDVFTSYRHPVEDSYCDIVRAKQALYCSGVHFVNWVGIVPKNESTDTSEAIPLQ